MAQYEELQDDLGLGESAHLFIHDEIDAGLERPSITVEPLSFSAMAVEQYRHHKKGIKKLGVLGLGTFGLGFSARAIFPRHV